MNYKDIYANANTKTPLERKKRDLQYRKMDVKNTRFLIIRNYLPALQYALGSLCSTEIYRYLDKGKLFFGCGALLFGVTSAGFLVYALKESKEKGIIDLRREYAFLKRDYNRRNKEYKTLKKKLR